MVLLQILKYQGRGVDTLAKTIVFWDVALLFFTFLSLGTYNQNFKVFDVNSYQLLHTCVDHIGTVTAMSLSPDQNFLVTSCHDRKVRVRLRSDRISIEFALFLLMFLLSFYRNRKKRHSDLSCVIPPTPENPWTSERVCRATNAKPRYELLSFKPFWQYCRGTYKILL